MLLRVTVLLIGLVQALRPRRVVDFWMNLATETDGTLRPWVYTAARIEGVIAVVWALRRLSDRSEA